MSKLVIVSCPCIYFALKLKFILFYFAFLMSFVISSTIDQNMQLPMIRINTRN